MALLSEAANQRSEIQNPAAVILRGWILSHRDTELLEVKLQSELNLAGVIYCARRPVERIG